MLRVRVLGELALEEDGERLTLPASRRARALLGLLAVDRRPHSRAALAAKFWPDVLDESARTSLRSALSVLRKALGPNADRYLLAGRDTVALAGEEDVWVDLAEFERLAVSGALSEALELSEGALLDGLDDDWVYERRDEHRDRVAGVCADLAAEAEDRGDLQRAIALTRRQVALDPLAEEPQRDLIRRLAAAGDRSAALTAYKRLGDRLRSELGIVPSAATRELVAGLREGPGGVGEAALKGANRPTGTVTLLFTDQVSSTETLERLGDDEAERLRRTHFSLLREVAGTHSGEEVKNLGDGLMVVFASALDAAACAVGIQQAVARHRQAHDGETFAVRVGLGVGEPIVDEDDYFGTPVVIAKRLCDAAAPGQILASDLVRALIGGRGGFEFAPLDPVALKGIAEPVPACELRWMPTTQQRIPLPPAVLGVGGSSFVGRKQARAELQRHWSLALDGERQVVFLSGEPGIGKTRLAAEFVQVAHEAGAAVLAGRCYEEMLVPYQPFAEALRHYVTACPMAELTVQLAPRRHELAVLVPELEERTAPPPRDDGATQERVRLFEVIATLLADMAIVRPTILVLDDLHWADDASLLLLRYVVRATPRARLMVLGTYRKTELEPGGDLAAALAELRRARAAHELELTGLAASEVAELIATQSEEETGARFARRVAERTDGNPFFIEELLRYVDADERLEPDELDIPASVKDLLARRLARLGEDARRALTVAAVAGREFEAVVVQRVMELSEEQLLDLLEAAVRQQVLVEETGVVGRFRFSHPLIRETIYEEISQTRRGLLHRRLAEALEGLHASRLSDYAGALAYHYRAAGDPEKAYGYHQEAAAAAERATAYETAFEHLSGAIAAGELLGLTARGDATMRELYRKRALNARYTGARGIAERDYEIALDAAQAAGDRKLEMHVLNELGTRWHVLDSPRAIRYHEQSLEIAEELGDVLGEVSALNRLSLVYANQLSFSRALELGERALELARAGRADDAAMRAMDSLKFVALQLGDIPRLEQLTAELETIQRQRKEIWFLQWTLLEASSAPAARGDWTAAIAKLDEAVAINERLGDPVSGPLMLHGRCWVKRLQGDYAGALADGRSSVELSGESEVWFGWAASALAMVLRDVNALEDSREILERGLAVAERIDARLQLLSGTADLSWICWLCGDEPLASKLLDSSEQLLDSVHAPRDQAYLYTPSSYTSAARTALALGQPARAEALVGRYLGAAARSGIAHAVAEGQLLLARSAELRGDLPLAAAKLAEALRSAGDDGLPALRHEIHAALARVCDRQGLADQARQYFDTARELLDRIARSIGDQALAERLRESASLEDAAVAGSRQTIS
jgi:class 3 adenylate cyclase